MQEADRIEKEDEEDFLFVGFQFRCSRPAKKDGLGGFQIDSAKIVPEKFISTQSGLVERIFRKTLVDFADRPV